MNLVRVIFRVFLLLVFLRGSCFALDLVLESASATNMDEAAKRKGGGFPKS